ncbi:hypothetical protein NKR23_g12302 [Pleurostoma richardsiae]|uniref:Uncharacterized protein n=1 Tax=Pleurostoma richardsiae TaxID=41990 RepID=A0AA38RET6_9PEZI|nr:hypothetical protein NKR23_g12302 [Pleurostoma richardsiae]
MPDRQTVILCQCVDGTVAVREDGCFPEAGSMNEAAQLYGDNVWFVRFVDMTAAMLVWLAKFRTFQEVLGSLCSRAMDGPRYSYIQLLAIEVAEKLAILKTMRRTYDTDWHLDIVPMLHELARISDRGAIYEDK